MADRALDPAGLTEFPTVVLDGTTLWRVFRAHDPASGRRRRPFFFSSGAGRYDLAEPRGTCYLATAVAGAVLETFRSTVIDAVDLGARRLLRTSVPAPVRLAATTRSRARRFGVTLDVATGDDHRASQRLAARFDATGFQGVHAHVRHDPTARSRTAALFDEAGAHSPFGWDWPERVRPLAGNPRVSAILGRFGMRVAEVPGDVPVSPAPGADPDLGRRS